MDGTDDEFLKTFWLWSRILHSYEIRMPSLRMPVRNGIFGNLYSTEKRIFGFLMNFWGGRY